jgi:hypothetical protein
MMYFTAQFVPTALVATTVPHSAVVMVTDTVQLFGRYWTRRHYWRVTCQCVGTDWCADPIRAGK